MSDEFWIFLTVVITNSVAIVCFVLMAVHFDMWYLSLLALLFQRGFSQEIKQFDEDFPDDSDDNQ